MNKYLISTVLAVACLTQTLVSFPFIGLNPPIGRTSPASLPPLSNLAIFVLTFNREALTLPTSTVLLEKTSLSSATQTSLDTKSTTAISLLNINASSMVFQVSFSEPHSKATASADPLSLEWPTTVLKSSSTDKLSSLGTPSSSVLLLRNSPNNSPSSIRNFLPH